MASTFDRAMQLMRKHNPQTQEDGFALLKPVASDFLPDLIEAYEAKTDHGLKCWLLELIGEARSEDAHTLLGRELTSDDESLRFWAEGGLRSLDTKAARTTLWERGFRTN
jgi:hypothetical protein